MLLSYGAFAQKVNVIKYSELAEMMSQENDTTYVVNFWATWCKPCMAELGSFETIDSTLRQNKVKVILVNLDFVNEVKSVQEMIDNRRIGAKVVLLNEPDYDTWINKISPLWSGAIPATLIINNDRKKRAFYEQPFDYQALTSEIKKTLK